MNKWLDKYEDGGILKQKTKDNYGLKPNPNDVDATFPPGFVGMGNNLKGRNYSPAWGGQFENGGFLPKAQKGISDVESKVKKGQGFLEKMANSPLFAERYATMTDRSLESIDKSEIENYRNTILKNLRTVNIGKENEYPGDSKDGAFGMTAGEYWKKPYNSSQKPHTIYIRPGLATQPTVTHELSHASTTLDDLGPKTPTFAYNPKLASNEGYDESNKAYYTRPTEIKARRDAVAEYMMDKGLWNPLTEKFTSEHYDKLKSIEKKILKSMEKEGPLDDNEADAIGNFRDISKPYDKEETIRIFNSFVKGPSQNILSTAQMGGVLPGAVGFTYARTQGAAPSNGPYAKKTKASAQNGMEMKYYQEGLDFKPKTISQDGSEIPIDPEGYWNPENWGNPVIIPSTDITMEDVYEPLIGISDTGDVQYMEPGEDYEFDGEYVTEYPIAQKGIKTSSSKLYVASPNDPRLKSYEDSLYNYNLGRRMAAILDSDKNLSKIGEGSRWDKAIQASVKKAGNNLIDNSETGHGEYGNYRKIGNIMKEYQAKGNKGILPIRYQGYFPNTDNAGIDLVTLRILWDKLGVTDPRPTGNATIPQWKKPEVEVKFDPTQTPPPPPVKKVTPKPTPPSTKKKEQPAKPTPKPVLVESTPPASNKPSSSESRYQMRGDAPVYGPANSLIGMVDTKTREFYPDYENTAARARVNQLDTDLVNDSTAMSEFFRRRGMDLDKLKIVPKKENGGLVNHPIAQKGDTIFVSNPNHPRLKSYQDSLKLHNLSLKIANRPNGDISYGRKPEGKFNKNLTAAAAMEYLYPVTPDEIAMSKLSNKSKILPTRYYPGEAGGVHFKKPVQPVVYQKPESEVRTLPTVTIKKEPLYVDDPNDPRLRAYQDSLSLYNKGLQPFLNFQDYGDGEGGKYNKSNYKPSKDWGITKVKKSNIANDIKEIKNELNWQENKKIRKNLNDRLTLLTQSLKTGIYPTNMVYPETYSAALIYKKPVQQVEYRKPTPPPPPPAKQKEQPKPAPVEEPKYQMSGDASIFGPANSMLGLLNTKTNEFYPDYTNTSGRANVNKADSDLISDPKALAEYLKMKTNRDIKVVPKKKNGGSVNQADAKPIEKLDQLLNFTNYNKPSKGGWLDKYQ
jgi:outer membrane biosynthesis protein TonB